MNARDRKAFEKWRKQRQKTVNVLYLDESFAAGARYARREMKRRVEEHLRNSLLGICGMCSRLNHNSSFCYKCSKSMENGTAAMNFKLRLRGGAR